MHDLTMSLLLHKIYTTSPTTPFDIRSVRYNNGEYSVTEVCIRNMFYLLVIYMLHNNDLMLSPRGLEVPCTSPEM